MGDEGESEVAEGCEEKVECTNTMSAKDKVFWEDCFLALLPSAIVAHGWKIGEQAVCTGDQRADLCAAWADAAVAERNKRFPT
jgi:hypothetical protein